MNQYPSIIDAAELDPEIAAMQSELHEGFVAPFHAVIERAKERGEVKPERAATDLIAIALVPLFFCRWLFKAVIDNRLIDSSVEAAVKAARID